MTHPPHLITENNRTFELGTCQNNRINYNFDRLKAYLQFKGSHLFGPDFKLLNSDDLLLLKLCAYFLQDAELCKKLGINPKKGILLTGPVGCGKTSFMQLLSGLAKGKMAFGLLPARNLAFEFSGHGFSVIQKYGDHKCYCLDDLGIEPNVRHFGSEINALGEIMLSRYELFVKNKIVTHATTNLNAQELEDRYGNRVRSRMRAMMNLIAFSSSSEDKRL